MVAAIVAADQRPQRGLQTDIGSLSLYTLTILWCGVYGATLCTACVLWLFFPHEGGRRRFAPWFAIVQYASSHCLLMLLCPLATVLSLPLRHSELYQVWFVLCYVGAGLASVVLWAATLSDLLKRRYRRRPLVSIATLVTIGLGLGWPALTFIGLMSLFG